MIQISEKARYIYLNADSLMLLLAASITVENEKNTIIYLTRFVISLVGRFNVIIVLFVYQKCIVVVTSC